MKELSPEELEGVAGGMNVKDEMRELSPEELEGVAGGMTGKGNPDHG